MQHLLVSGAVRPLKWPLGIKWLIQSPLPLPQPPPPPLPPPTTITIIIIAFVAMNGHSTIFELYAPFSDMLYSHYAITLPTYQQTVNFGKGKHVLPVKSK
jgi:hypothetical protein